MSCKKYIFIDYFDTIVFRKIHPDWTKKLWARKLSVLLNYGVSADIILQTRLFAEVELARQSINGVFNYRELSNNIYRRLCSIKGFKYEDDEAEFFKLTKTIEEDIEIDSQTLNKKIIAFIRESRSKNIKIYIVSDFYLGKDSYIRFLKSLGIVDLFDGIYVSCDYRSCKANGSLYREVLNLLKLEASQVMMIGDNKRVDYYMARQEGIYAKCVNNSSQKKKYNTFKRKNDRGYLLKKIFNRSDAISNYAFSIYLFCDLLYKNCLRDSVQKLFFLAREGLFLKQCFDHYLKNKDSGIQTYYLYASRNSTFGASLQDIDVENFNVLFRQYNDMSIEKFLELLNFTQADMEQVGVGNIGKEITCFHTSQEFKELKENGVFIDIYNKKRTQQKYNFCKYLEDSGYCYGENLFLVDVGWKGSMQDNIFHMFGGNIKVCGYYLGLSGSGELSPNNIKNGILFDTVTFSSRTETDIYMLNMLFYELILSAGHGKTISYNNEGKPVLVEDEDVLTFNSIVNEIQKDVFLEFKKLSNIYLDNVIEQNEIKVYESLHNKMFKSFGMEECNIFWRLMSAHRDSFLDLGTSYNKLIFALKMFVKPYIKGKYYLHHKNGIKK